MNINILNDHCRVLNFDIHNNQDHTTINLTMLKENYRILALKYHPDHNFDSVESTEQFKIIHASYEILIDHISKNGTIITPTTTVYDTIEIDDMDYDEDEQIYYYPCPCGDQFTITVAEMYEGENIAKCSSCTLMIRIIYDVKDLDEMM
jgi:diphthamide biosynthesis protein 3